LKTPPFRLAPTADFASAAASAEVADRPVERVPVHGARLYDLPGHLMCSVIGTCLGLGTLRKLVPRYTDVDRERATDLEIHHAAVELATAGEAGAKSLHKALDEHHGATIRRFRSAATEAELDTLWREALQSGEVPGAYWAVLTHARATTELRARAFGEVHMLSHLVGAANRADIRRLVALEHENGELRDKVEHQQVRLRDASVVHEETVRALRDQIAELSAQCATAAEPPDVEQLRQALRTREQQVTLHASRRDQAEHALALAQTEIDALRRRLQRSLDAADATKTELLALEEAYAQSCAPAADTSSALSQALQGKRIVYVGGRPSSNAALRDLVQRAGGEIVLHDGGIEDRKGMLSAAAQGADLVLFPVDCIDHDSAATVKRLCARLGVPFVPLRSASVSSFVAALLPPAPTGPTPPASPFCIRHG
jgi:hypothetical protein